MFWDFSQQWDTSASGSTNYLREIMFTEEINYGICLWYDKASHLGKKLLLPRLPGSMLYELDMQDPQKDDYWPLLKKVILLW